MCCYPRSKLTLTVLCCLAIAGCSSLSKSLDYLAKADSDRQNVESWSDIENGSETAYLNQLVSSPGLDSLIVEARAANPGLQQTLLSLDILRAQYRVTRAGQLPDVDAAFNADKTEEQDTSYTGEVTVSWELDLWSKIADESSAAATTLLNNWRFIKQPGIRKPRKPCRAG